MIRSATQCWSRRLLGAVGAAVLVCSASADGAAQPNPRPTIAPGFGQLPLSFEAGANGEFIARGRACEVSLTAGGAVLTLTSPRSGRDVASAAVGGSFSSASASRSLALTIVGANPAAQLAGQDKLAGRVNYLLGNDAAQWRVGQPLFGRVQVAGILPGVDLVYYGNDRRLEYDFLVAPGADPRAIALQFSGADRIRLGAEGDLIFSLGETEIRQPKPIIYQNLGGRRVAVQGSYVLGAGGVVTFSVGDYDRNQPLVIDPVLSYSSYFGGSGEDVAWDIALGSGGFIYLVGESMGGLPVNSGTATNTFGGSENGRGDAFVAKFDPAGTNLVYLTYIGGRTMDVGLAIAVDESGHACVTGYTDSTNFPVVNAISPYIGGAYYPGTTTYPTDAFVAKLKPDGTGFVYSTYLGSDNQDLGSGISLDAAGNAYVAGYTTSSNFPMANASLALRYYNGFGDAFITKFSPAGTNLLYSFYLGGSDRDIGWDVVARADGVAYVTGSTRSTNFFDAVNLPHGGYDVFVTEIGNSDFLTTADVATTYFGGTRDDEAYRLQLHEGSLYLAGSCVEDPSFPISPGGLNPGGVAHTADGATTWASRNHGLPSVVVTSLAFDPADSTRLLAGTWHGVARSLDGGLTWQRSTNLQLNSVGYAAAVNSGEVLSVLVLTGTPPVVLAGTSLEGVWRSSDGGLSWLSTTGWVSESVVALAASTTAPATIYAGTDEGVFKSTDGGVNWRLVNSGLGNHTVLSLALNATNDQVVYAGTAKGVYRSSNGGTNWSAANTGLGSRPVQTLAIHPGDPSRLFAGTTAGIFLTTNGATAWDNISVGLVTSNVNAIALDASKPEVLYAGTTNGVFKSVGASPWTNHSVGLPVKEVLALAIHPTAGAEVYAGLKGVPFRGTNDAFVAKLNAATRAVEYSTVWGGKQADRVSDLAVDTAGRVHLAGRTSSTDFPTVDVVGLLRATNSGAQDAFVARLSSDGLILEHCALLGGSASDAAYGIALDSLGQSLVVGATASANFPTYAPNQNAASGSDDGFLVKLLDQSRPTLSLAVTNSPNPAVLTWPGYWPDFYLEGARGITGTVTWYSLTNLTSLTNGWFTAPFDGTYEPTVFFRLRRK